MIIRAFYSSPLRSHASYGINPRAGVYDAMGRLAKMSPRFDILLSAYDVRHWPRDCIWSPLLQGDVLRGELLHYEYEEPGETYMLEWCLETLRDLGFNTLILSSAPRAANYGNNGMDSEQELAEKLGLKVIREVDITG